MGAIKDTAVVMPSPLGQKTQQHDILLAQECILAEAKCQQFCMVADAGCRLLLLQALESGCSGIFLLTCGPGKLAIQLGPSGFHPSDTRTLVPQRCLQFRHHHNVIGLAGLSENPSVAVKDHRITRTNLVVINADSVTEKEKHPIIMSPAESA
jgi:hypothetical protein